MIDSNDTQLMYSSAPTMEDDTPNMLQEGSSFKSSMIFNPKYSTIHINKENNNASDVQARLNNQQQVVGFIDVSGHNGLHAQAGRNGSSGRNGRNAYQSRNNIGDRGENGENGGHGEDAPMANNGDHSDNLSVLLDRSCHIKELVVKYSRISHRTPLHRYGNNNVIDEHQFQSCSRFPLNSPNEFVMMKANGGNGGNGGRGGNGGSGGNGGNGAPGTLEGGDGGDGGHGGNAGRPSNGGNGGNAGSIEINAYDPRLFVILKTQVLGGSGGLNGVPGEPGSRGRGGHGGMGKEKNGRSGRDGNDGSKPHYTVAYNTQVGNDGFTLYRVLDFNNRVMFEGQKCYSAHMLSFDIEAMDDDGIYEPGETIFATNFKVHNDGDIPLPAGAVLRIAHDPHGYIFSDDQYILPEIGPRQTITIPNARLEAKINPLVLNTNNGMKKMIPISVQIDLFERVFTESLMGSEIPVEYPISITNVEHLKQMGRGDSCDLYITFSNNSKNYYPLVYRVTTKDQLFFVETEQRQITNQSHVNAESFIVHSHPLILGYCSEFYQNQEMIIELFYKDVLIQRIHKHIQAVPHFNPTITDSTDVLLITNSTFSREDFKAFSDIFQLLGLRVNFWDSDFYKGISFQDGTNLRHNITWVDSYRGKLIILCAKDESDILKLSPVDITSHFGGPTSMPTIDHKQKQASGLLVLMPEIPDKDFMKTHLVDPNFSTKLPFDSDAKFCGYYKIYNPKTEDADDKCNELENEAEKDSISRVKIIIDTLDIKQIKSDSWISWKYSYGKASMYQVPLNILQTLVGFNFSDKAGYLNLGTVVDQTTGEIIPNIEVASLLTKRWESINFKLLYSIVYSLSLFSKFRILQDLSKQGDSEIVKLIKELIRWTIFESVKREVRLSETFPTLEAISGILEDYPELICEENVYTVVNTLYKTTTFTYWKSWIPLSFGVSQGFKKKREKIQCMIDSVDEQVRKISLQAIKDNNSKYFDVDATLFRAQEESQSPAKQSYPKLREVLTFLIE